MTIAFNIISVQVYNSVQFSLTSWLFRDGGTGSYLHPTWWGSFPFIYLALWGLLT